MRIVSVEGEGVIVLAALRTGARMGNEEVASCEGLVSAAVVEERSASAVALLEGSRWGVPRVSSSSRFVTSVDGALVSVSDDAPASAVGAASALLVNASGESATLSAVGAGAAKGVGVRTGIEDASSLCDWRDELTGSAATALDASSVLAGAEAAAELDADVVASALSAFAPSDELCAAAGGIAAGGNFSASCLGDAPPAAKPMPLNMASPSLGLLPAATLGSGGGAEKDCGSARCEEGMPGTIIIEARCGCFLMPAAGAGGEADAGARSTTARDGEARGEVRGACVSGSRGGSVSVGCAAAAGAGF